jgi:hypothetical protein
VTFFTGTSGAAPFSTWKENAVKLRGHSMMEIKVLEWNVSKTLFSVYNKKLSGVDYLNLQ